MLAEGPSLYYNRMIGFIILPYRLVFFFFTDTPPPPIQSFQQYFKAEDISIVNIPFHGILVTIF